MNIQNPKIQDFAEALLQGEGLNELSYTELTELVHDDELLQHQIKQQFKNIGVYIPEPKKEKPKSRLTKFFESF